MVKEKGNPEGRDGEPETGEQGVKVANSESAPVPKQPANEIKVVIVSKDGNILLGVQAPECDPVYTTMKGDLGKALKKVPGLVAKAKQKWEAAPQYPKANLPEPPPRPTPARTSAATKSTTSQPPMF